MEFLLCGLVVSLVQLYFQSEQLERCMKESCDSRIDVNLSSELLQPHLEFLQSSTELRCVDFRCHVSSTAAIRRVIDHQICQRHTLALNDNDPNKQLKSVLDIGRR